MLWMLTVLMVSSAQALSCRVPPARYDHEPSRPYRVIQDPALVGNALTTLDRSTIIIPANATPAWKRCYLRHEKGHVNGWGGSHRGMRNLKGTVK